MRHDAIKQGGTPFFSIVIPCYNRSATIGPTITSCLQQTHPDFEVIVVDDGSTDDLQSALATFNDPRVRYLHQENGGGGKARNTGIEAAQGKYIAFLDSDDTFTLDKLEVCRREIEATGEPLIYSYVHVDRGPGRTWIKPSRSIVPGEDVGEYLFADGGIIQTSSIVIETDLAKRVQFDPTLPKGQDLDFCVRLGKAGETFHFIPRPLAVWTDRGHAGRTSHKQGAQAPLEWLARSEHLLTERARLGYRASVLSYYLAREAPLAALNDILEAHRKIGLSSGAAARLTLRAFLPQAIYRSMVDGFIDFKRSMQRAQT